MKTFQIKVDDLVYTVKQCGNHYNLLLNETEILELKVTVGKNLEFHWESDGGQRSHLISKIGVAIEQYDLQRYL